MKIKLVFSLLVFLSFCCFSEVFCETNLPNRPETALLEEMAEVSDFIRNVRAEFEEEGLKVFWEPGPGMSALSGETEPSVSFAYFVVANDEGYRNGVTDVDWKVVEGVDWQDGVLAVAGPGVEDEILFRFGVGPDKDIVWSEIRQYRIEEPWGLFDFFVLLGSLALFLYGMKIMSEGLQQAAGANLRNLLGSIAGNRVKGIFTGMGITALIQSSSATTVMIVSFVNAGLMTLTQSAGVIMGSNIGTTISAWIVDLFGFKVDLSSYALIILVAGLPLLFFNDSKWKGWANALIGFAFLFMGLGYLKNAVPAVGPDSGLVQFFITLNGIPYISTIIFVIFGALLTVIIQSSSATIALTMTLLAGGVIPFEAAAAMVLGENIGTTITAEIAATVGNVHAKRAARIHSTFNIAGVIWAVLTFPIFLSLVVYITARSGLGNPMENPQLYGSSGLAVLHTTFNVINVLVFIGFVPLLVRFVERTVKPKGEQDEQFRLDYINSGTLTTPNLSIFEAKRELAKFGELTGRMSGFARDLLLSTDKKEQKILMERIAKYEDITDRVEVELANFLNNISGRNLNKELAVRIRGMNIISNNLERIGDIFFQISKNVERKNEGGVSFSADQENNLLEMFDMLDEAFRIMCDNLNKSVSEVRLDQAIDIEARINTKRDVVKKAYFDSLSDNENLNLEGEIIYYNIVASLERVGDHIINVSEGLVGKV